MPNFTTDVDFRISMLAPSRAGKTTLLAAIYNTLASQCAQLDYLIGCDSKNLKLMKILDAEYSQIFVEAQNNFRESGKKFFSANIRPSSGQTQYQFFIHTPERKDYYDPKSTIPEMTAGIVFRDYPGGLLVDPDKLPQDLVDHINLSRIMFVPIPADILEEYCKNSQNNNIFKQSKVYLNAETICKQLQAWIDRHVKCKEECFICFVPVKCEHMFKDNGGIKDRSNELFTYVEQIFMSQLNFTSEHKKLVQIEIRPVDTYGISEYSHAEIDEESWNSYFQIRELFSELQIPKPRTKGAFELIAASLHFMLSSNARTNKIQYEDLMNQIHNRSIGKKILVALGGIFGKKDNQMEQSKVLSDKMAAFSLMADGIVTRAKDNAERVKIINKIL